MSDATFAEKGVPAPRHAIGDTVWIITQSSEDAVFPCPDCNGTGTWKAVSPRGLEFEVDCPRCSRYGSSFSGQAGGVRTSEMPRLGYRRTTFGTTARQITGIEIRQPPWHGRDPISYSFGNNSNAECDTYPTEDAAQAVAHGKQVAADAKRAAEPAVLEAGRFSSLQLRDAIITRQHDSLWDSWWVARHLLDEVEAFVDEDKRSTSKEDVEYMFDDLDRTVKRLRAGKHYTDPGPFMKFMDWLEEQASGTSPIDPTALTAKLTEVSDLVGKSARETA